MPSGSLDATFRKWRWPCDTDGHTSRSEAREILRQMENVHSARVIRDLEAGRDAFSRAIADKTFIASVSLAAGIVVTALQAGRKILFAGNGGSAADAQHLATELVVRFVANR